MPSSARWPATLVLVILPNEEYGVLKWFAGALKATGLPSMEFPGIDYCAIAQGYGVRAVRIASRDELATALVRSVASDSPSLIEVPSAPSARQRAAAGQPEVSSHA